MYVVIIDMDQPENRRFLGMTDDWELAPFDTLEEIKELKKDHGMGVFTWLVIHVNTDPTIMTDPPYSMTVLR